MSDETKKVDDGGRAFPCEGGPNSQLVGDPGMSLRDWFAGMALQGLLAHSCDSAENLINEPADSVSRSAFKMADAMIERRKR